MDRDGENPNSLAGKLRQRITQPQIYKFLEGVAKEPKRSTLLPLAEHYGIPVDAFFDPAMAQAVYDNLMSGAPLINRGTADLTLPSLQMMAIGGPSTLQPILAWEHESDLPPGEFVMVPRLNVLLSAGNGHEQIEIEFVKHQPQAFRADWIRRERLKPNKLASMNAQGDSMEPVIFHDDALIVDTSQTAVSDGKVYAIWYEGGERVKRLYRLPGGGLRIKSDNPAYDPIELRGEDADLVRVIGRVVHRAGNAGL